MCYSYSYIDLIFLSNKMERKDLIENNIKVHFNKCERKEDANYCNVVINSSINYITLRISGYW